MGNTNRKWRYARELRRNMTPFEKQLWQHLRKGRIENYRFLRQYVVSFEESTAGAWFFILDFYCPEVRLGIELDGKHHRFQQDYDNWRDALIRTKNIRILRFENSALLNLEHVISQISTALKEQITPPYEETRSVDE
jgi:very-short-patch-repair endonuclease